MSTSLQTIYISRFQTGFDTYDQPEIMPDDANPILEDVIAFRGVLRKRDGYELLASIPQLTVLTVTVGNPTIIQTTTPHLLTSGQQVMITGLVGDAIVEGINNTIFPYDVTVTGVDTFTITYNSIGGVYTSGGTVCQPTMGLETRLSPAFFEDLVAFTETQAYIFLGGVFVNISGVTTWTGQDFNFFWSANYFGSFWATNNVDPIRYYITGVVWTNFTPQINAALTTLQRALLIFPYKNRLVVLSTTEAGLNFPQRARWSQNGTPYVTGPTPAGVAFDVDAWREDIAGRGGFIDAPTSEKIVTAGFVRDTLVVMFERSAWRLRYTANETLPFIWERINSQLGAEASNSVVGFDYGIMSIGRTGITLTDTNSCKRFEDRIIPDQVFQMDIENNNNTRIHGIRDYQKQLVYWTYVNSDDENLVRYPNKVLCYNYLDNNWSIFNQQFTVYGNFRAITDLTWAQATNQWQNENRQWNSGNLQTGNITVVAGDRFGNVFLFTPDLNDDNTEAFNFNITTKKFNPYIQQGLQAKAIYAYILVSGTAQGQFSIQHFIDENSSDPIEVLTVPTNTNNQEKVWRRVQLSGTSQYHQFVITFSTTQAQIINQTQGTVPAGQNSFGPIKVVPSPIVPGSLAITFTGGTTLSFVDNADGTLTGIPAGAGTIDYSTGNLVLGFTADLVNMRTVVASFTRNSQIADSQIPFQDYDFFQFIFEFAPAGRLNYGDFTT